MSTHYDRTQDTFRIASDEPTRASAWSSSRLGDPEITGRYRWSDPDDFGFDETPAVSKPRSTGKVALAAAAAIGAIGGSILLGAFLFGGAGSSQPQPAGVVPGANVQPVSPNAPAAVPPAAPAPDPGQAAPAPDPGQAAPAPDPGPAAAPPVAAPPPAAPDPAQAAPAPDPGQAAPAPPVAPGNTTVIIGGGGGNHGYPSQPHCHWVNGPTILEHTPPPNGPLKPHQLPGHCVF
jgi:hypothetical protein